MDTDLRLKKIRSLENQIQEIGRGGQVGAADPVLQRALNEALIVLAQERAMELERVNRLNEANVRALEFHRKRMAVTVHDLKAPITISLLNLELMAMEDNPDQISFYVCGMRRELEFMLETIGSLLDLERSDVERAPLRLEPLSMHSLIGSVIERMSVLILDKPGLQLINNVPEKLPPVLGDHHKLIRVFNNLFANAIKYTEKGQIKASATANSKNKKHARITLSDTGSGIDKERLASMFTYYQADSTQPDSTGIGLAYVKQVVDAHEGDIWIESTRGKGTKVFIELPLNSAVS